MGTTLGKVLCPLPSDAFIPDVFYGAYKQSVICYNAPMCIPTSLLHQSSSNVRNGSFCPKALASYIYNKINYGPVVQITNTAAKSPFKVEEWNGVEKFNLLQLSTNYILFYLLNKC